MKKTVTIIICILALVFSATRQSSARLTRAADIIETSAKSVYLIDYGSNTEIYAKNENARLPIASMCKIMTLDIILSELENGVFSLEDKITVSENASGMGGSQVFLEAHRAYKAGELIKSIIMSSANDACVAFAEFLKGSESLFVEEMNARARLLGADNTAFVNCTGLPRPMQYSTARDVAKMLSSLIKHETYYKYSNVWLDKLEHEGGRITELTNTNKLVRFYEGCDGGKTGYTAEAGHCLAATAKRGGMRLISVVISAPDSKSRFKDVSSMLDYGFANYTSRQIVDKTRPLDQNVAVKNGEKKELAVYPETDFYYFSAKNAKHNVTFDFIASEMKAPIKQGEKVGELAIYKDSVAIGSVDLIAGEDILEISYFGIIKRIIDAWRI